MARAKVLSGLHVRSVGWAKALRAVPTVSPQLESPVGALRFAHPTQSKFKGQS